ncbi:hypothetical protein GW17_00022992 [Ensete ventricosum]|nr:hypothetical protein GW17_00022992 [Ensete ventricosum]RZR83308.1 hypothetical protein BHM03_00009905 [Ensete ventricosum]
MFHPVLMTNQIRGRKKKKKNTNQLEEPPADLFRQHDIGGRVAVALEEHRRRSLRDFHGAVGDDRALPPARCTRNPSRDLDS